MFIENEIEKKVEKKIENKKNVKKVRLDVFLYEKGYFESREKAKISIIEGKILVNNQKEDKPGTMIKNDSDIKIIGERCPYVSRGGLKLEKALNSFHIDVNDLVCADIGSSTGGFTDCLLQNNAKFVYAIDCGTNQLVWSIRCNKKVKVLENTNARYLTNSNLDNNKMDFVSADVSFISLTKILQVIYDILNVVGKSVVLIKPQFEAGRELVEKNGVVHDKKVHIDVIKKIIEYAKNIGFVICGLDFSPIKGPAGNIEYLLYLEKVDIEKALEFDKNLAIDIENVVEVSHTSLM